MNLKKIFLYTITLVSILSTGLVMNNASANNKTSTNFNDSKVEDNKAISNFPKSMRGTWYTDGTSKIIITKDTIKSFEINNPSKFDVSYLHKSNKPHHTGMIKNKTKNWVDAAYVTYDSPVRNKWLNVDDWNAVSIDGSLYNVSKIYGRKVLTLGSSAGNSTISHSYTNKKLSQKLQNKKYPQFTYDELFNQHE